MGLLHPLVTGLPMKCSPGGGVSRIVWQEIHSMCKPPFVFVWVDVLTCFAVGVAVYHLCERCI